MKRNIKDNRIGETNIANNGMSMTIIDYKSTSNITVKFEDGTIVANKNYNNFLIGCIRNPNLKTNTEHADSRLNQTNTTNDGYVVKIIKYNKYNDITVQFEDGTERRTDYKSFQLGSIRKNPRNRIGETNMSTNDGKMTIIDYKSVSDITVKFETGEIREHTDYKSFKNGHIQAIKKISKDTSRIGETVTASNGLKATIIAYRRAKDIDIEFEDGIIVTNKDYCNFKRGSITHPTVKYSDFRQQKRIGEKNISTNNGEITIIEYFDSNNITVQFEDGTIRKNTTYKSFKTGKIKPVKTDTSTRDNECMMSNKHIKMQILKYNNARDCTVEFETGEIRKKIAYEPFKKGQVLCKMICNNIKINKKAYIFDDKVNFYCHCNICGENNIMTVAEMKEHKCDI